MNLKSKTLLITGAAGRIGSELARKASEENYDLVLTDISEERLNILKANLNKKYNNKIYLITCNLDSENQINKLLKEAISHVGIIDNLVHCAYPTSKGWGTCLDEISEEYLKEDLFMQLGCSILLAKNIIQHFQLNNSGNLIFISSIQGVQSPKFDHYEGTSMSSPIEYAAIKSGVISISKWLAKFYKNQNIRINCISPGGILDSQPQTFVKKYRESCTNIGLLNSMDLSSIIIFLLKPDSFAINGQNIIIDDGWTL